MTKLRVLDLFSGIGGFSLGLEETKGFETVAFCEIEEFPRAVLRKHWPDVPIFEDVRKLRGEDVGPVDVICGGYPCQPFSTAGRRRGAEDDRHLWPQFSRLVAELRPAWVIGENVAGHISMGLDDVLSDLEGQGYACRSFVIPACAVDAPHRRDRVWTVGHASSSKRRPEKSREPCLGWDKFLHKGRPQGSDIPCGPSDDVAHAKRVRQQGQGQQVNASNQAPAGKGKAGNALDDGGRCQWRPEPAVGRVANGIPRRVDRLKALGNAVVPQVVEMFGRAILAAEAEHA